MSQCVGHKPFCAAMFLHVPLQTLSYPTTNLSDPYDNSQVTKSITSFAFWCHYPIYSHPRIQPSFHVTSMATVFLFFTISFIAHLHFCITTSDREIYVPKMSLIFHLTLNSPLQATDIPHNYINPSSTEHLPSFEHILCDSFHLLPQPKLQMHSLNTACLKPKFLLQFHFKTHLSCLYIGWGIKSL